MKTVYVYDAASHTADSRCLQKWHWCRIHWITRFEDTGEKWYEAYPIVVNRKTVDGQWVSTPVYCGPGTFYPKPRSNRSYAK